MANKNVFGSTRTHKSTFSPKVNTPKANTVNEAGGIAYSLTDKHSLAQYAATGCLTNTFYASAEDQLDKIIAFAQKVDSEFLGKCALYIRSKGHMKDTPALLLAILSARDDFNSKRILQDVFPKVIDNGKMLRNFCQIVRSGKTGKKSFGSHAKRLVQNWLNDSTDIKLLAASIGNDPSIKDVIRMVHPKPINKKREAFFRYLLGYDVANSKLPEEVRSFENFKSNNTLEIPEVPFELLTSLNLTTEHWTKIGYNMKWHALRMNLNTLERHGVLKDDKFVDYAAKKLSNAEEIKNSRVFPYQLMMAYTASLGKVPSKISNALQTAMEIAVSNIPQFNGNVVICPDVSGSMKSPVTGNREGGVSTSVSCIDVAALIACSILRQNKDARVIPFEDRVVDVKLNPHDSIMTNSLKLASVGGGGTRCSAPIQKLVRENADVDLIIYISDNCSWADFQNGISTESMNLLAQLRRINKNVKVVAIDLQPYASSQFKEGAHVLNIGGFSDMVFEVMSNFASNDISPKHWVDVIEKTKI